MIGPAAAGAADRAAAADAVRRLVEAGRAPARRRGRRRGAHGRARERAVRRGRRRRFLTRPAQLCGGTATGCCDGLAQTRRRCAWRGRHDRAMVLLPLVITLLLTLTHTAVAHAERWQRRCSRVAVAREFDFDARRAVRRRAPAAGCVSPATRVRPCAHRAAGGSRSPGRLPRLGPGVSLRCGAARGDASSASSAPLVRRGAVVIAGRARRHARRARHAAPRSARRPAQRWGYRDPLALLGGAAARPLGPVAASAPALRPARRPSPPPAPGRRRRRPGAAHRRRSPPGLGAALAGVGAGTRDDAAPPARRGPRAKPAPAASGQRTH